MVSLASIVLATFAATTAAAASAVVKGGPRVDGGDIGNWKVGDCILAQFALEIEAKPIKSNPNITEIFYVPTSAKADQDASDCGNSTQIFNLYWTEVAKNDTSVTLGRNLTMLFVKNETQSSYGMSRFFADIEYAKWNEKDENGTEAEHTSTIRIDSHVFAIPIFRTPLDRSFLCNDVGHMSFETSLMYDYDKSPPAGIQLPNATVEATKLQIDVFRTRDHAPTDFRIPMDCDYHPDDAVPIAVGIALAVMVVAVLVAYMYGRRRNLQRGYESV